MNSAVKQLRCTAFVIGVIIASAGATALAVPVGYEMSTITFPTGFQGAAALAFAPDGTLYVVEGKDFTKATNQTHIHVVNPDGSMGTPIPLAGDDTVLGGNIAVGGIAVHPTTGNLYITDDAPGATTMYRVDPVTGIKTSFSGSLSLSSIDDVAIRSTGEIFVSDAAGSSGGSIVQFVDGAVPTVTTAVSDLELTAPAI